MTILRLRYVALSLASAALAVACSSSTNVDDGSADGGEPPGAPAGTGCTTASECQSRVCTDGVCQQPSPTDGVKNGDETDVDCGGSSAPKCAAGKTCNAATDCADGACKDGKCAKPSAVDGDCGGADPAKPRCADGATCVNDGDCASKLCDPATKTCKAPSATDGIKNGDETDVDCGGKVAPKCAAGKTCAVHADCASDGCAYDKTCASHPSCTQLNGGYTCGPNEVTTKQQDCCDSAKVGTYTVDKYLVTAGRMRAFLDRLNGDVRSWAAALPAAKWDGTLKLKDGTTINDKLPSSYAEANDELGPLYDKRACQTGSHTGHTFWTPPSATDVEDFPQDVRDRKVLNCVPWWLLKAFCVWDGGHLATEAEIRATYTNANTTSYPWGAIGTYTTTAQNDYAIGVYNYATPNPPATAHTDQYGYKDIVFYIAPPGRKPNGYNKTGHADMVGDLLEWVSDRDRQFIWKGSFENHASEADNYTPAPNDPYLARDPSNNPWQWGYNIGTGRPGDGDGYGYYGIGGRCAR